jgi:hypothetical protein
MKTKKAEPPTSKTIAVNPPALKIPQTLLTRGIAVVLPLTDAAAWLPIIGD